MLTIEIAGLFANNPHNYISDLSFDPLINPQSGQSIDVAYVAGFASYEDAQAYIEQYTPPIATADEQDRTDRFER